MGRLVCRYATGKQFQLKFNVPTAGTYSLSVLLISDYWIGADAKWATKVKVLKRTKVGLYKFNPVEPNRTEQNPT
jgi:hypothetical protein